MSHIRWKGSVRLMRQCVNFISDILFRILLKILSVFHIKRTDQQLESLMQFIKFGIVGVTNTLISYLIYIVTLTVLQKLQLFSSVDYLISSVLSWLLSVLWSFIWNRSCVFEADGNGENSMLKQLFKTYFSYAFTGLLLSNIILRFEVKTLGISKVIAPFFVLIISVPINFILNKFWAFRDKGRTE